MSGFFWLKIGKVNYLKFGECQILLINPQKIQLIPKIRIKILIYQTFQCIQNLLIEINQLFIFRYATNVKLITILARYLLAIYFR